MRQAVFSAREETRTVRMLKQLPTGERSVTDASTVWNGVPDQGYNVSSCHYLLPLRLFHRPAFSMQAPHQDTGGVLLRRSPSVCRIATIDHCHICDSNVVFRWTWRTSSADFALTFQASNAWSRSAKTLAPSLWAGPCNSI